MAATLQQVARVAQHLDMLRNSAIGCRLVAICCAMHAICCGFVAQQAVQQVAQQIAEVEFGLTVPAFTII